jgi:hypothetical protein
MAEEPKEFKPIIEDRTPDPPNDVGRPTDYKPEYCQKMVDYFNIEPTKEMPVTITTRTGSKVEKVEEAPNIMPTLEKFAFDIGVTTQTLWYWANMKDKDNDLVHPEFSEAYFKCKQLQKNILVTNGLLNNYNSNFAIFVAKNFTDMEDKQKIEQDTKLSVDIPDDVADLAAQKMKEKIKNDIDKPKE